jgi:hypothetical protein
VQEFSSPLLAVTLAGIAAFAPPAAAQSKSDKAILKAGVITKADVPTGWTSKKGSTSEPDRSITECKKIRTAVEGARKKVPRAESRDFRGTTSGTTAEDSVYTFRNARSATAFIANYRGADAEACFQKIGQQIAPSGSAATVSPVTDLQGVGDEALGYEITFDGTAAGETVTAYVDFIIVRVGRTFLGFGFSNRGERIPEGPTIVRTVVARVAEAQA